MTRLTKFVAPDILDQDEKSIVTGEFIDAGETKRAAHVRDQSVTQKLDDVIDAISNPGSGYAGHATPHAEVGVVVTGLETTLLSYTITSPGGMNLLTALASGENIGKYKLKVNGSTIQTRRSWWGSFNVEFETKAIELDPGDVITVTVVNDGEDNVAFEASLIGGLK